MGDASHRFRLGSFDCTVVLDGTRAYSHPAEAFFANAPAGDLGQTLRRHGIDPDGWDEYTSPYPSLVVRTGQHTVLVDTGAGSFVPTTGRLIPNLEAEGISPADIDTVILTHAHLDHIGGNVGSSGEPAFPNARYVMWKDEWEFWTREPDLSGMEVDDHIKELLVTGARDNLLPIRDRLDLVDREGEILPGIHAVPAPGHTPGHMVVSILSGGQELLCIADAALHPVHLDQPAWHSLFDLRPEEAKASRRRLMDRAAADEALVLAFHFPFPGLGHVVKAGEGWTWEAVGKG